MKKFVNFRFVVTLVLAIFANVATYAQDNVVDEVVWVVGDEAILKSDVEEARMDALYNGRRFEGDPYCVIPEEIAVQKLFLHQASWTVSRFPKRNHPACGYDDQYVHPADRFQRENGGVFQ